MKQFDRSNGFAASNDCEQFSNKVMKNQNFEENDYNVYNFFFYAQFFDIISKRVYTLPKTNRNLIKNYIKNL